MGIDRATFYAEGPIYFWHVYEERLKERNNGKTKESVDKILKSKPGADTKLLRERLKKYGPRTK